MKVFFDNNTSPVLARTLDGFVHHLGHEAKHIADLPCGRHCSDLEWIEYLAKSGSSWIVITGDGRILKNKAERAAFREAGLLGFVLNPAYQKTPTYQVAALLIWRWPDIEQLASLVTGAAMYELPIRRSSKIANLPL